jgi:hypothetical protein
VQIYQASQLYDVIASLYFPLNPGIYNGTVPGGQNSLTIQNASFWQFQYQDPVNGTITIPPYTTVAFTVNPGQAYTITPQWALVDTAVTGVLVLPYGWLPADVSVSGNYSPIALAPSVTNTWPYVQSPVTVAGEFGPQQNDVEIQPRPPQLSAPVLNTSGIASGATLSLIAGVAGQAIRLRKMATVQLTSVAAQYLFESTISHILAAALNTNTFLVGTDAPDVISYDFEGFALPVGEGFQIRNTFTATGPSLNIPLLTADRY